MDLVNFSARVDSIIHIASHDLRPSVLTQKLSAEEPLEKWTEEILELDLSSNHHLLNHDITKKLITYSEGLFRFVKKPNTNDLESNWNYMFRKAIYLLLHECVNIDCNDEIDSMLRLINDWFISMVNEIQLWTASSAYNEATSKTSNAAFYDKLKKDVKAMEGIQTEHTLAALELSKAMSTEIDFGQVAQNPETSFVIDAKHGPMVKSALTGKGYKVRDVVTSYKARETNNVKKKVDMKNWIQLIKASADHERILATPSYFMPKQSNEFTPRTLNSANTNPATAPAASIAEGAGRLDGEFELPALSINTSDARERELSKIIEDQVAEGLLDWAVKRSKVDSNFLAKQEALRKKLYSANRPFVMPAKETDIHEGSIHSNSTTSDVLPSANQLLELEGPYPIPLLIKSKSIPLKMVPYPKLAYDVPPNLLNRAKTSKEILRSAKNGNEEQLLTPPAKLEKEKSKQQITKPQFSPLPCAFLKAGYSGSIRMERKLPNVREGFHGLIFDFPAAWNNETAVLEQAMRDRRTPLTPKSKQRLLKEEQEIRDRDATYPPEHKKDKKGGKGKGGGKKDAKKGAGEAKGKKDKKGKGGKDLHDEGPKSIYKSTQDFWNTNNYHTSSKSALGYLQEEELQQIKACLEKRKVPGLIKESVLRAGLVTPQDRPNEECLLHFRQQGAGLWEDPLLLEKRGKKKKKGGGSRKGGKKKK